MEDFPGNSHKVTEKSQPSPKKADTKQKKEIEKVVTGEVVQKKKPLGRRFKEVFFTGEFKGAVRYISTDVLIPAFKNMIVDATNKGIESIIYGESAPRRRSSMMRNSRVQYNNPMGPRRYGTTMLPDQPPRAVNRRRDIEDIILVSREEAELVVERLQALVEDYGEATVADLHELVGLPSVYTDNNWGWSGLQFIDIRQVRDGFLIMLPSVEPI